LNTTALEYATV